MTQLIPAGAVANQTQSKVGFWRKLYFLIKREWWENRVIFFWLPLTLNVLISILVIYGFFQDPPASGNPDTKLLYSMTIGTWSMIITSITGVGLTFYLLGSLYEERRDKSILLWKSMPISDLETVLSKVILSMLVVPALCIGMGLVASTVTLLMTRLFVSFPLNLSELPLIISGSVVVLFFHVLWGLPTVGWLMLCSVWAKARPVLWAVLIPLTLILIVALTSYSGFLNHSELEQTVKHVAGRSLLGTFPFSGLIQIDQERPGILQEVVIHRDGWEILRVYAQSSLGSLNMWIGVLVGVGMLALATYLRRWRDEL